MVSVALLAAAMTPTWAPAIGWSALALTFGLGELGRTVGLPDWLIQLSPFAHVPQPPRWRAGRGRPPIVPCAVAALLTSLALAAYRLRDTT